MGSNYNGVEVGLNKYAMVWNLPSLYTVWPDCVTPQKKLIDSGAWTSSKLIDKSINSKKKN